MTSIIEIETAPNMVHFSVMDERKPREYIVLHSPLSRSFTIVVGKWINSRRSFGKTFWSTDEIAAHYKQDGRVLADYASRLAA